MLKASAPHTSISTRSAKLCDKWYSDMNSEAASAENDTTTVVGALVAALATVSVALRFYARHSTRAGYKWDDWLILLALLTTIATDILVLWGLSPLSLRAQKLYS